MIDYETVKKAQLRRIAESSLPIYDKAFVAQHEQQHKAKHQGKLGNNAWCEWPVGVYEGGCHFTLPALFASGSFIGEVCSFVNVCQFGTNCAIFKGCVFASPTLARSNCSFIGTQQFEANCNTFGYFTRFYGEQVFKDGNNFNGSVFNQPATFGAECDFRNVKLAAGSTPLEAIARCIVKDAAGDEFPIPESLL